MTVDATITTLLCVLMIECFMLALVVMTIWKISAKGEFVPFFGGVFVYLAFTLCVKGIIDMLVALAASNSTAIEGLLFRGTTNNPTAFYAVGSVVLTVALETLGRFLGYRCVHKTRTDRRTAVSFGLGFGAAEAIVTVGLTALMYFSYAVSINEGGGLDALLATLTGSDADALRQVGDELAALTAADCVWMIVERAARLVAQVALAVMVFASVHDAEQRNLLWIGAGVQLVCLLPLTFYQIGGAVPQMAAEITLIAGAAALAVLAWRAYHQLPAPKTYEGRTRYL